MSLEKRIALVDDHNLVRAGFKKILNGLDGYKVVSEGASGLDAIEIVKSARPDVLVMDVSMPRLSGIEALKQIRAINHQLPVLMLSMYEYPDFAVNALKNGADSYIVKDSSEQELRLALDYTCQKKPYISPSVNHHLIQLAINSIQPQTLPDHLTCLQREVLACIAEGLPNRQIATRLAVSIKTVESHRTQIMHRLGLNNSRELIRFALNHQPSSGEHKAHLKGLRKADGGLPDT